MLGGKWSYFISILSGILCFPQLFRLNFKHESEIPRVQCWRLFSQMDVTAKHLKSLLQGDLVIELEKVKANIIDKIKQFPKFSQSKLYEHLAV